MRISTRGLHEIPSLEKQKSEDLYIGSLDPLQSDDRLTRVPAFNKERDVMALVMTLQDMLPAVQEVTTFDYPQACAAMRDIGILLGSIKRHGVEPVHVVPSLEDRLNLLGEVTNLPPRDTLIHYVRWNPEGSRLRTYTGTEDEHQLIKSVQVAFHPLYEAILSLHDLYHVSLDSSEFSTLCDQVISQFEGMVHGVVNAKRNVSPQYFAEELRFYFDPIQLNGREYLGPGAVEMPVFLFDHILWSCDVEDETYTAFKKAYVPYNQAMVRDLYAAYEQRPSLVSKAVQELSNGDDFCETRLESAKSLVRLFNLLKSFRAPHKKLADKAYEHAAKDNYREKGSGGYEPGVLHYILQLNLNALQNLKARIQVYERK